MSGESPGAAARGWTVLVADDEESMRHFLRRGLSRHGFDVVVAKDGAEALALLAERSFDAAVLDLRMPRADGLQVVSRARAGGSTIPFVVMTAYGTIPSAVEAMRHGAFDYVTKPFEVADLVKVLERALAAAGAEPARGAAAAPAPPLPAASHYEMLAESPAMADVARLVEKLGSTTATVLVSGESGTGKEVVARAIHERSLRAGGPFVAVNCAAIPPTLFESELFGHVEGAFTGASRSRRGLVHGANGGTLFLDEIGEIDLATQAKLVRFLEDRAATPVGGTSPVPVDVRIVAATQTDLGRAVDEGRFRRDLHGRLAVVPISLPPLRERREDVPRLANRFLARVRRDRPAAFTPEALRALRSFDWPGNVRQLENVVERIAVLNPDSDVLGLDAVPDEIRAGASSSAAAEDSPLPLFKLARDKFEKEFLEKLFEEAHGNITQAARLAGLSRANLHRKLRQLGIDASRYRE